MGGHPCNEICRQGNEPASAGNGINQSGHKHKRAYNEILYHDFILFSIKQPLYYHILKPLAISGNFFLQ